MGVVVWGYRGGVGTLRIRCKLSTYGGFRHTRIFKKLKTGSSLFFYSVLLLTALALHLISKKKII